MVVRPAPEPDGVVHQFTGLADHHLAQQRHGWLLKIWFQWPGRNHNQTLILLPSDGKPLFAPLSHPAQSVRDISCPNPATHIRIRQTCPLSFGEYLKPIRFRQRPY
jgi:hypothetical protein